MNRNGELKYTIGSHVFGVTAVLYKGYTTKYIPVSFIILHQERKESEREDEL